MINALKIFIALLHRWILFLLIKLIVHIDSILFNCKRKNKLLNFLVRLRKLDFTRCLRLASSAKVFGMPSCPTRGVLIADIADFDSIQDLCLSIPLCYIESVFLVNTSKDSNIPDFIIPSKYNKFRSIPIFTDINKLYNYSDLECILYIENMNKEILYYVRVQYIFKRVHIVSSENYPYYVLYYPYYYATWSKYLIEINTILADTCSRDVLIGRVKALCSGDIAYYKYSKFVRGYHPYVLVRPGNIVLEAYGNPVAPHSTFAEKVTQTGKVLLCAPSFLDSELDSELATMTTLLPVRLTRYRVDTSLEELVASVSEAVTSLDALLTEQKVSHLDFLSLDLGGGELNALRGAEKILRKYKPNLTIAVYHDSSDLMTIPAYIAGLRLGYVLYLGHHSLTDQGTILYASARPGR